jgi:hypothetical protein
MMSEFMIADPWAAACIKGDRPILSLEIDNVNVIPGPVWTIAAFDKHFPGGISSTLPL